MNMTAKDWQDRLKALSEIKWRHRDSDRMKNVDFDVQTKSRVFSGFGSRHKKYIKMGRADMVKLSAVRFQGESGRVLSSELKFELKSYEGFAKHEFEPNAELDSLAQGNYEERLNTILGSWNNLAENADGEFGNHPVNAHGRFTALNSVFSNHMLKSLEALKDEQINEYKDIIKEQKDLGSDGNKDIIKAAEDRIKVIESDFKAKEKQLKDNFNEMRHEFVQHFTPNNMELNQSRVTRVAMTPKWLRDNSETRQLANNPRKVLQQEGGIVIHKRTGGLRHPLGKRATTRIHMTAKPDGSVSMNIRIPKKMGDSEKKRIAKAIVDAAKVSLDTNQPFTFDSHSKKLNGYVYAYALKAGWKDENLQQLKSNCKLSKRIEGGFDDKIRNAKESKGKVRTLFAATPKEEITYSKSRGGGRLTKRKLETYRAMKAMYKAGLEGTYPEQKFSEAGAEPEVKRVEGEEEQKTEETKSTPDVSKQQEMREGHTAATEAAEESTSEGPEHDFEIQEEGDEETPKPSQ